MLRGRCVPHARCMNSPDPKERTTMKSIHEAFRREGLVRVQEGRVLGGVIAGLGRRIGLDPWPARLLFILLLMLVPGSQLLVYPILWILMPQQNTATQSVIGKPAPTSPNQ